MKLGGIFFFAILLGILPNNSPMQAAPYGNDLWEIGLINSFSKAAANRSEQLSEAGQWLTQMCVLDAIDSGFDLNKEKKVEYSESRLCRSGSWFSSSSYRIKTVLYWIKPTPDKKGRISINLRYRYAFANARGKRLEDSDFLLGVIQRCLPRISSFWSPYGLDLNFEFDTAVNPNLKGKFLSVKVHDLSGTKSLPRSTDENYIFEGNEYTFCRTMLHEVGHSMGLDDEYLSEECPDRKIPLLGTSLEKNSLIGPMSKDREPDPKNWSEYAAYPRHVAQIISPLCHWKDSSN